MIFEVTVFQELNNGNIHKITRVRPYIESANESELEKLKNLNAQPEWIGNSVLTSKVMTNQGIQTVNEPFNFPIQAENIQEAFTKFEEAGQQHVAKVQQAKQSRIITDIKKG